jgi:signal transduction histidine kinase/ligand-binding sensor domain-containing protein
MSRSSLNGSSTCRSGAGGGRLARALIFTAITAFATGAEASDVERSFTQYLRDRWDVASGFPGGPIYAIAQTSDGYLWIGAEKGLVRFDGVAFRLFDPGSDVGASRATLGVVAAPDGGLWARVRGAALLRYHAGVFQNILPDLGPPESVVSALLRGREDTILLATLGRGALAYRRGQFAAIATPRMLPSSSFVISMAEAPNGDVWLGTRDAGLIRVEGDRVTRLTDGLPALKINCLLADGDGEIWIGTDGGIVKWNGSAITNAGVPAALQRTTALQMMRDRASNVWIAAGPRGLLRVSAEGDVQSTPEKGSALRPGSGQALGHVATVFEDRDGNVWVGTEHGLERWRDPIFTTYSAAQGIAGNAVGPVYADEAGRVWFGPASGGLFSLRAGVVREATEAGLADDVAYSIHGAAGDVWVGRRRGGVTRLRTRGGNLHVEHYTQRQGLAQDSVFAVHRARDGSVWAGTLSGGVSLFRDGRFATYDTSTGLPSNTVASILESRDGSMWFGTPNGLSTFSRGGWRTFTSRDGLPANDINALFEDRAGVIWVGTSKGIAVVEAGRTRAVDTAAAHALRGAIHGFAEDRHGSLWITGVDQVIRVDRESLMHGGLRAEDVREYGVADGLLGIESLKRHGTVVADVRGRIWFALTRGLSVADPARAEARGVPALSVIEDISADGAPLNPRDPIRIPSSRRRISFSYAGLSLSVPERVRFRYRVDGFDSDWSAPVAERQAVYTNLAPGRYRFRLIASNSDGSWDGAEATLPFDIEPMLWQTLPFQASIVVVAGAVGWGLYHLRVRAVARRLNERFEERLAERTHIAQELHDTLLQGFVSASMQLHVAVERLPEDSAAKPALGRVLQLMRGVIEEGRHAVRGLRSTSTAPHELEQAFAGVQEEIGIGTAEYRVIVEGPPRPLRPIARDEVYRIGREALVNAFRHSGATRVEIELEYGPKELALLVRDDGRGMGPQPSGDGHFGIVGMHERARRIGGTLKIRSRAAAGTEVELRIPARLAFERQRSGRAPATEKES